MNVYFGILTNLNATMMIILHFNTLSMESRSEAYYLDRYEMTRFLKADIHVHSMRQIALLKDCLLVGLRFAMTS